MRGAQHDDGGAKPGDRTMIDALNPAIAALSEGQTLAAARAARAGADAAAAMTTAGAGRSNEVSGADLGGVADPAPRRWPVCSRRWSSRPEAQPP